MTPGGSAVGAAAFLPARIMPASLRGASRGCMDCDLFRNATQTVFGRGAESARVTLVPG